MDVLIHANFMLIIDINNFYFERLPLVRQINLILLMMLYVVAIFYLDFYFTPSSKTRPVSYSVYLKSMIILKYEHKIIIIIIIIKNKNRKTIGFPAITRPPPQSAVFIRYSSLCSFYLYRYEYKSDETVGILYMQFILL